MNFSCVEVNGEVFYKFLKTKLRIFQHIKGYKFTFILCILDTTTCTCLVVYASFDSFFVKTFYFRRFYYEVKISARNGRHPVYLIF